MHKQNLGTSIYQQNPFRLQKKYRALSDKQKKSSSVHRRAYQGIIL